MTVYPYLIWWDIWVPKKEARERVKIALKNSGYQLPAKRLTVNLSPADIRKEGTAFDLPVAIAILQPSVIFQRKT